MKAPGLARGLLFALFAGLGTVPWLVLTVPWFGYARAVSIYLLLLPLVCLPWQAPNLRRGLGAALLATLLTLPAALADLSPSAALLCALFALGLGRSGVCYPRPLARALFLELALAFTAALVAGVVFDRSLFGSALAVWSFWLVQSAYPLWPGSSTAPDQVEGDAFERARAAAERLLQTNGT